MKTLGKARKRKGQGPWPQFQRKEVTREPIIDPNKLRKEYPWLCHLSDEELVVTHALLKWIDHLHSRIRGEKHQSSVGEVAYEIRPRLVDVKGPDFVHSGRLTDEEHQRWLRNPYRHVHGGSREYNQRRTPEGGTLDRAIHLEDDYSNVCCSLSMTAFEVKATESTEWNGSWDNIVRSLEERW